MLRQQSALTALFVSDSHHHHSLYRSLCFVSPFSRFSGILTSDPRATGCSTIGDISGALPLLQTRSSPALSSMPCQKFSLFRQNLALVEPVELKLGHLCQMVNHPLYKIKHSVCLKPLNPDALFDDGSMMPQCRHDLLSWLLAPTASILIRDACRGSRTITSITSPSDILANLRRLSDKWLHLPLNINSAQLNSSAW
ncbi:hypothetical protein B0H13DRAFT_233941 [Mycena leptocephala]|nr:hypothetical protein B0H13DRAFT_233941 [Mycena leptocephala]